MSKQQHLNVSPIHFYATPPHECSYIPSKLATTVFVDPNLPLKQNIYQLLTRHGFRRSGEHIYKPQCENCQQCIPVRLPVKDFKATRNQKRVLRKNKNLHVSLKPGSYTREYYALYDRYIRERHSDGDMYPPNQEQFEKFLLCDWSQTQFIEFRNPEKELISVAVIDPMEDGFSAVYTFFEPSLHHLSLGKLAILTQIELLKEKHLPYLYLGYYIKSCKKMNYKTEYRPIECLINEQWCTLT
ncbi:MAG: arginyltransferase [Pseudomonadota bacterium]